MDRRQAGVRQAVVELRRLLEEILLPSLPSDRRVRQIPPQHPVLSGLITLPVRNNRFLKGVIQAANSLIKHNCRISPQTSVPGSKIARSSENARLLSPRKHWKKLSLTSNLSVLHRRERRDWSPEQVLSEDQLVYRDLHQVHLRVRMVREERIALDHMVLVFRMYHMLRMPPIRLQAPVQNHYSENRRFSLNPPRPRHQRLLRSEVIC